MENNGENWLTDYIVLSLSLESWLDNILWIIIRSEQVNVTVKSFVSQHVTEKMFR